MDAQLLIWIVEHYTEVRETIIDPMAGSGTTMLACTLGRSVVLVELEEKFCKMMRDNWEQVRMRPQLGCEMGNCQIIKGDARALDSILLVDKIITSPPYAIPKTTKGSLTAQEGKPYQDKRPGRKGTEYEFSGQEELGHPSPDNIANKPYGDIDSIITSPPYEGSLGKGDEGSTHLYDKYGEQLRGEEGWGIRKKEGTQYSENKDNLGNLKSVSYLEAMLAVYRSCWAVLRPQGLMILVTKNFIRNQKEIRLDTDTIKLCEQAGFHFLERHYRKLPSQSFWRVIYQKKYPTAPVIDREDILVFRKVD